MGACQWQGEAPHTESPPDCGSSKEKPDHPVDYFDVQITDPRGFLIRHEMPWLPGS